MEAKLAEYRAKKATEQRQTTPSVWKLLSLFRRTGAVDDGHKTGGNKAVSSNQHSTETTTATGPDGEELIPDSPPPPDKYRWLLVTLKVILWLLVWALFIELQFGAVFFAVSALLFVYINTRTGKGSKKSLSAYSVFNPNCERLQGTITAEQFEAELLYRKPQPQS